MPLSLISLFVAVDQLELDSNYSVPVHCCHATQIWKQDKRNLCAWRIYSMYSAKKGTINLAGRTVQPDFMPWLHLYIMKKYQKKNRGQM